MGGELVWTNDRVSFVGNPTSSAWISYLILEVKEHVCLTDKKESGLYIYHSLTLVRKIYDIFNHSDRATGKLSLSYWNRKIKCIFMKMLMSNMDMHVYTFEMWKHHIFDYVVWCTQTR